MQPSKRTELKKWFLVLAGILLFAGSEAWASGGAGNFEKITALLIVLLLAAKWLGFLFKRLGFPELVGELAAGVVLGNLGYLNLNGVEFHFTRELLSSEFIQYASELGVVLLLFVVGLESNLLDLIKVGRNAFAVAAVGVVLPVLAGFAASPMLGLGTGLTAWFIGATLAATSVGVTAKVLGERQVLTAPSSQVILGAAVIDDILGILILTVLAAVATTGQVQMGDVAMILVKALGFFAGAWVVGRYFFPHAVRISSINESTGFIVVFALTLSLVFAEVASWAGLAPIIGAFVAGLLLEDVHFVAGKKLQKHNIMHTLEPLNEILLPIFFVKIGSQVDLSLLTSLERTAIVSGILVLAIIGKVAAGYVVTGKGFDRLGIGLGMVPRGEVGLIFAAYALDHKVFDSYSYSLMVLVVLATTIVGPLLLRTRLQRF